MTTVTRDAELAGWTKSDLITFLDQNSIPAPDGLSPSKVKKLPKDELIQIILDWEQAVRMAAQAAATNHQNTPGSKLPWVLQKQAKTYDPTSPTPDAFRLKKIPSNRNREAIYAWAKKYGFGDGAHTPSFTTDDTGLVMISSTGANYDFWSTGSAYFVTLK